MPKKHIYYIFRSSRPDFENGIPLSRIAIPVAIFGWNSLSESNTDLCPKIRPAISPRRLDRESSRDSLREFAPGTDVEIPRPITRANSPKVQGHAMQWRFELRISPRNFGEFGTNFCRADYRSGNAQQAIIQLEMGVVGSLWKFTENAKMNAFCEHLYMCAGSAKIESGGVQ